MLSTRLKAAVPASSGSGTLADALPYAGDNSDPQTITTGFDYTASDFILLAFSRGGAGEWLSASTDPDKLDPGGNNALQGSDINSLTSTSFGVSGGLNNFGDYVAITLQGDPGFMQEVAFSGTASPQNVAHGLSATPEMVIVKNTQNNESWVIWCTGFSFSQGLAFDNDNALSATATDVLGVNATNVSVDTNASNSYVLYAFTSTSGNFDTGAYTGSASAVPVACGFQPKTVWLKSTTSALPWRIYFEDGGSAYYYDISDESTTLDASFSFTATGFTVAGYASGQTVQYMAFG